MEKSSNFGQEVQLPQIIRQAGQFKAVPVNWVNLIRRQSMFCKVETIDYSYQNFFMMEAKGFRCLYVSEEELEGLSLWELRYAQCFISNTKLIRQSPENILVPGKRASFQERRMELLAERIQQMVEYMAKCPSNISLYVYLCIQELRKLKNSILHFDWRRPTNLEEVYHFVRLFQQYGWYLPVPLLGSSESFSDWYMKRVHPSSSDPRLKEYYAIMQRKQTAQYATFLFFLRHHYHCHGGLSRVLSFKKSTMAGLYKLFYKYVKQIPLRYQLINQFAEQLKHQFFISPKVNVRIFKKPGETDAEKKQMQKKEAEREKKESEQALEIYQSCIRNYMVMLSKDKRAFQLPKMDEVSEVTQLIKNYVSLHEETRKRKNKQIRKMKEQERLDKKNRKKLKKYEKQLEQNCSPVNPKPIEIEFESDQGIKQVNQAMIEKVNNALIQTIITPSEKLDNKLSEIKTKIKINYVENDKLFQEGIVYTKFTYGKLQYRCMKCAMFFFKRDLHSHQCDSKPLSKNPRTTAYPGTIELYRRDYKNGLGRCIGCMDIYSVRQPHSCCPDLPQHLQTLSNLQVTFQVSISSNLIQVRTVSLRNQQAFRQKMILRDSVVICQQNANICCHPMTISKKPEVILIQTPNSLQSLVTIEAGTYFGFVGGQIFHKDLKKYYGSKLDKSSLADELKFVKQVQDEFVFLPIQHYTGCSFIEVNNQKANCQIVFAYWCGKTYAVLKAIGSIFKRTKLFLSSGSEQQMRLCQQLRSNEQKPFTTEEVNQFIKIANLEESFHQSLISQGFNDQQLLKMIQENQKRKDQGNLSQEQSYESQSSSSSPVRSIHRVSLHQLDMGQFDNYEQRIAQEIENRRMMERYNQIQRQAAEKFAQSQRLADERFDQYLKMKRERIAQDSIAQDPIVQDLVSRPKKGSEQIYDEQEDQKLMKKIKSQAKEIQQSVQTAQAKEIQQPAQSSIQPESLTINISESPAKVIQSESFFSQVVIPEYLDSQDEINEQILDQCMLQFIEDEINQLEKKDVKQNPLFALMNKKMTQKQQSDMSQVDFMQEEQDSEAVPFMKWPDSEQVEAKDPEQVEAKDPEQVEAKNPEQVEAKDVEQVEATKSIADSLFVETDSAFAIYKCQI